jgi:hypothetical protein
MKITAITVLSILLGFVSSGIADATSPPRLFLYEGEDLLAVRSRVEAGDPVLKPAMDKLINEAEAALGKGPFSVMDKAITPPSGDKHDYMSVGPYWWPNPDTKDGLPYVRRDGEVNPERHHYDNVGQSAMVNATATLGLAYFMSGDERYAAHAAKLLRVWYLDEATRMNPHLKYGQAVPGRTEGRGIGIIDTTGLINVIETAGMLAASPAWTAADREGLIQWFSEYLDWLLTHPYGKAERGERNNHGTWYDAQAVSFALFCGREDIAREILDDVPKTRIDKHFMPDGSQPHELARTRSYPYSVMNLRGFFHLAAFAEKLGIDLWNYQSEDGRSIRKGLDWIVEHAFGSGEWEHRNMAPIAPGPVLPLLHRAALAYKDTAYEKKLEELAEDDWMADRHHLLYPALDTETTAKE